MTRTARSCRQLRILDLTAAAVIPLLAALTASARAQAPNDAWTLERTATFRLQIDGTEAEDARFYLSEPNGFLLVDSKALPGPFLLRFSQERVALLASRVPAEREDGTIDISFAGETAEGSFDTKQRGTLSFALGERKMRIEPSLPVVGDLDLATLKMRLPVYARRATLYHADAAILAELRTVKRPVRLQVYFASWCPTCERYLPKLLRVNEDLQDSPLQIEYHGLRDQHDSEVARYNIVHLPLGIVYQQKGDTELGRITGAQWETPERALRDLLAKSASPHAPAGRASRPGVDPNLR